MIWKLSCWVPLGTCWSLPLIRKIITIFLKIFLMILLMILMLNASTCWGRQSEVLNPRCHLPRSPRSRREVVRLPPGVRSETGSGARKVCSDVARTGCSAVAGHPPFTEAPSSARRRFVFLRRRFDVATAYPWSRSPAWRTSSSAASGLMTPIWSSSARSSTRSSSSFLQWQTLRWMKIQKMMKVGK